MTKQDKQLESFINQAQKVVKEWVIAAVEDKDCHPKFTNQISMICDLAKKIMEAEDDKESD